MAGKQSEAVNVYWRWLTVPAPDHGRTSRDHCMSMDDWGIAYPAERTQPKLAA